jgi:Family of unknown function (DUF6510)
VDYDEAEYVDGNAAAGAFAEAFRTEVTTTMVTCATCGRAGPFADQHVYDRGPGVVARCPTCGAVNARMVRTPTAMWLELHGSSSWRIALPPRE